MSAVAANNVVRRLIREGGLPPLAYIRHRFCSPDDEVSIPKLRRRSVAGVVFLHGYHSDMTTDKANVVEKVCRHRGVDFVKFDYTDHGLSIDGEVVDGEPKTETLRKPWSFEQFKADALTVIDQLTDGPQVLVGSSMGGWLSLLTALERPQRIVGLLTIACAVGFTDTIADRVYTDPQMKSKLENGEVVSGDYGGQTYTISKALFDEGRQNNLLKGDKKIPLRCPLRLLHCVKDEVVPYKISMSLVDRVETEDVELTLTKTGDHRMASEVDLKRLEETLEKMLDSL